MVTHVPSDEEMEAMTPAEFKAFENRVRRGAERQGYRMEKSRRRDRYAPDYRTYRVINPEVNGVMYGTDGLDLAGIARWLWEEWCTCGHRQQHHQDGGGRCNTGDTRPIGGGRVEFIECECPRFRQQDDE
jgi:hypothetical protein